MFSFFQRLFGLSRKNDLTANFLRAAGEAEPERQVEASIIRSCRERFGTPPRACGPEDRIALDPRLEQAFLESNDGLLRILKDQDLRLAPGPPLHGLRGRRRCPPTSENFLPAGYSSLLPVIRCTRSGFRRVL